MNTNRNHNTTTRTSAVHRSLRMALVAVTGIATFAAASAGGAAHAGGIDDITPAPTTTVPAPNPTPHDDLPISLPPPDGETPNPSFPVAIPDPQPTVPPSEQPDFPLAIPDPGPTTHPTLPPDATEPQPGPDTADEPAAGQPTGGSGGSGGSGGGSAVDTESAEHVALVDSPTVGSLPSTGATSDVIVALAAGLTLVGGTTVVFARRRTA